MEKILPFIINNWQLWLAFAIILALIIRLELSSKIGGVRLLTPQEVTQLINRENAVVVDTRQQADYDKGHIVNAIHSPSDDKEKRLKKLQKYKAKPIIISCGTGQTAPKLGNTLLKEGFEKVFALKGGMAAWQNAGLPVTKASS